MAVRETSIESNVINRVSGQQQAYQHRVIEFLQTVDAASRREIAKATGIETATVPSIVLPLIRRGLVEESTRKYQCSITGRKVFLVRVKQ